MTLSVEYVPISLREEAVSFDPDDESAVGAIQVLEPVSIEPITHVSIQEMEPGDVGSSLLNSVSFEID
jgi:hypothetical protein